ncbi:caspase family protein [Larkinella sp. C7]|jgi:hypothetical protein|uniref:caspase family protein n=1 Tax=Larkinella sp. C7 TaxID=2576607 RepID=UPI0014874744|nr:caspase family protein [Larkinella sp. C7]
MKIQLLVIQLCLLLVLTEGQSGFAQTSEFEATSPPFRFDIRKTGPRPPVHSTAISTTSPPYHFNIRPLSNRRLGPNSHVLLVANEKYDDERFRDLPDATFDAAEIGKILKDRFGFRTDLLLNATRRQLEIKLQELNKRSWQPNEQLLIYISGHGEQDNGQGYLIMKDSDKDDQNNYFPMAYLKSLVDRHKCKHILLILDTCYGGAISHTSRSGGDGPLKPTACEEWRKDLNAYFSCVIKDQTRLYLSSGSLDVVRGGRKGEHSPFAKSLLQKLSDTTESTTKTVSISELIPHLAKDNPQLTFTSEAEGGFLFVAY